MSLLRSIRRAIAWVLFGEVDYGHTLPEPNSSEEWYSGVGRCTRCLRHRDSSLWASQCPGRQQWPRELA